MRVLKRDGRYEELDMNKVKARIYGLCFPRTINSLKYPQYDIRSLRDLSSINIDKFTLRILSGFADDISTIDVDKMSAVEANNMALENPEYGELATRILVNNLQKNISMILPPPMFFSSASKMHSRIVLDMFDPGLLENPDDDIFSQISEFAATLPDRDEIERWTAKRNLSAVMEHMTLPYINDDMFEFISEHRDEIEEIIDYSRDYSYNYVGFQTLQKQYLHKLHGTCIELPQHMIMRVAIGIWHGAGTWEEIRDRVVATYDIMSLGYGTHATPTLFNAGSRNPQMSSCYLLEINDDSFKNGITDWWGEQANYSKYAGGLGTHVHKIRAAGSYIKGTNGYTDGLPRLLRVANAISEYANQSQKRPGSHAIYCNMYHADIEDFIRMKLKRPAYEAFNAPSLFYAIWRSDEFMRTLRRERELTTNGVVPKLWYLMTSSSCPGLEELYDAVFREEWITDEELAERPEDFAFTAQYRKYIKQGKYVRKISATALMEEVFKVTQETSIPYKCNKDHANRLSNQKNAGVIKSSNLCAEIYEITSPEETAVCNLASVCVNRFIEYIEGIAVYNFDRLGDVVYQFALNLDRIIDINFYPHEKASRSNLRHRPMGIGQQGLADAWSAMGYPADSLEAYQLSANIAECIYYHALRASVDLAIAHGAYETFAGSPASQGKLKMDLLMDSFAESDIDEQYNPKQFDFMYDWDEMRERIMTHGLRNSLRTACMPTGTTSTIMGNSPSTEPHNAIVYKRTDSVGESMYINTSLIHTLIDMGLWTREIRDSILSSDIGSIQHITAIPEDIRANYKTVWDEGMTSALIKHAMVRNLFVDQGQSMNLFVANPTIKELSMIDLATWRSQLPTSAYYTRRRPPIDAKKTQINVQQTTQQMNTMSNISTAEKWTTNDCVMCSS